MATNTFEFNGKEALIDLARKAGIESKAALVAQYTLFTHPDTVAETQNKNLFQVIRDFPNRGKIVDHDGLSLMACDNSAPQHAFEWANGNIKKTDIQINHIYSDSKNHQIYTSLANLCATPVFIAKLSDTDGEIKNLLRYRAFDLYGFWTDEKPLEPQGYSELEWMSFLKPLDDLEGFLRKRLKDCAKSRTAISCRELGWYFSGFQPDSSI